MGMEQTPSLLRFRMRGAVTVLAVLVQPRSDVDRFITPGRFEHQIVDHGIVIESLVDEAKPRQASPVRITPGTGEVGDDLVQLASHVHLAAKGLNIAPQPGLATKGVGDVPHGRRFAEKIQHEHAVVLDRIEKGLEARLGPEVSLKHEGPALQDPHCLRVTDGHAAVDGATQIRQIFQVTSGRDHLDEAIGRVEVVRSETLLLLGHPQTGDLRELRTQRVQKMGFPFQPLDLIRGGVLCLLSHDGRHMAGETLHNRGHAQLALPGQNALAQPFVSGDPGLGQRATPTIQTTHPLERQIGWTRQKLGDLRLRHAQLPTHRLPHRFLTRDR